MDAGHGSCRLAEPVAAAIIANALAHFDGQRYRTLAWCVMPNHVQAALELLGDAKVGAVVASWKSFTAKQINALTGSSGRFWQPDYYDRAIRDEAHLAAVIAYIEGNPVKAGLVASADLWHASSASATAT